MEMVIVTLRCGSGENKKHYDMEMPCGVPALYLVKHICETLRAYSGGRLHLDSARLTLYCPRLDRTLHNTETLENAGIWNGDYLELK